jgi:hypothetical protein
MPSILSSFELIVEPLVPFPIATGLGIPDPVSVQAYFLLLSNPEKNNIASVQLDFISNPNTSGASTFNGNSQGFKAVSAFENLAGNTSPATGFTITSDKTAKAIFSIPPLGTVLFLLQPDVSPLKNFDVTSNFGYDLRGYVEINAMAGSTIFASPQIRGTFFSLGAKGQLLAPPILQSVPPSNPGIQVYSQQAYSLTTPGSSLFSF